MQREDSLSLAHRRMSAAGSPIHARHSTRTLSKGDSRRSRFHFSAADLLPTETLSHVRGMHLARHDSSVGLHNALKLRRSKGFRAVRMTLLAANHEIAFLAAGSIRALYHRSISLNLPNRHHRCSTDAARGALRHKSPAHKSARKAALSEGTPGEAEPLRPQSSTELPDGPENGQGLSSATRAPSRSSLKMSRQVWPMQSSGMCRANSCMHLAF